MTPDAPPDRTVWRACAGVAALEARLLAAPRFSVVLVLLALAPIGVVPVLELILRGTRVDATTRQQWALLFLTWAHVRLLLPAATLYVGASLWADETESGTAVYVLTRPVPRGAALVTKWVVAWAVVVATLTASATGAWAIFAVAEGLSVAALWPVCLVLAAGAAPYLAVFTLCGVLTSRGLILGLIYAGLSDGVLWVVAFVARKLALCHYTGSALAGLGPFAVPLVEVARRGRRGMDAEAAWQQVLRASLTGAGDPAGPWEAWLTIAGVTVVALGLAAALVHFREYAPTRST